jgi:hypothetical protein
MLIILCLLVFPPAWPFVLLYYALRGLSGQRTSVRLQRRSIRALEQVAVNTAPPSAALPAPVARSAGVVLGWIVAIMILGGFFASVLASMVRS